MAPASYCIVCDAPGQCEHNGPRYLEPIRYELVEGDTPRSFRWHIPELERDRCDNGPGPQPSLAKSVDRSVTLPDLITQLSRHAYVDERLQEQLADLYSFDPLATSQIVAAVIDGAASGRLHHPAGALAKRLKDLASRAMRAPQ